MEEGNSSNKNNLTSSMKNKSRVSKLATGSNIPPPPNGSNPPPRSRLGRPPLHPSSLTNAAAPRRRGEQDQHIPISNIIRVMRQILPASANICDEAKETIQECISKFINHITEEANKIRTEEQRKVLTADDIVAAMSKKRFESYADLLSTYLYRYREAEGKDDFIQVLRMRLFRPDAGMVPPPVMADPYFYPHDGVSIGGGGHGQYVNQEYATGIGGGHGVNVDHGCGMTVISGGSDEFVNHVYGSTNNSTMMNFDAGSSSFGSTVNSTMTNFDAGSSSYGSTVNSTMMNFHVGSSCNSIDGGCNEYDGHWYGVTGIGGGRSEYTGQGYDSTINPMMNFVGSYNNNFGGYTGQGYDSKINPMADIDGGHGGNADHGYGMVDINGGHGESVNQRYGDGVDIIGGGSGQYAGHGYGVDIGGGGVGENVDQGYASTTNNNTMMNFGVLESSSYNYNDNNVLLEYNDVFDGLLAPNSTQNVESIDEFQVMK